MKFNHETWETKTVDGLRLYIAQWRIWKIWADFPAIWHFVHTYRHNFSTLDQALQEQNACSKKPPSIQKWTMNRYHLDFSRHLQDLKDLTQRSIHGFQWISVNCHKISTSAPANCTCSNSSCIKIRPNFRRKRWPTRRRNVWPGWQRIVGDFLGNAEPWK